MHRTAERRTQSGEGRLNEPVKASSLNPAPWRFIYKQSNTAPGAFLYGLEQPCRALSAADTHRDNAVLLVAAFQLAQDRSREA